MLQEIGLILLLLLPIIIVSIIFWCRSTFGVKREILRSQRGLKNNNSVQIKTPLGTAA